MARENGKVESVETKELLIELLRFAGLGSYALDP
jgi:hypothetical protein